MAGDILTHEELKSLLNYNKDTGIFVWLVSNSNRVKVGDVAGTMHNCGYVSIKINRQLFLAHRLAALYVTGEIPECEIDHINGVRNDNRWANLRLATHQENLRNTGMFAHNTSGVRGVYQRKDTKKWQAQIKVNGKHISLGSFVDIEDAYKARNNAAKRIHGDFFRASDRETSARNNQGVV